MDVDKLHVLKGEMNLFKFNSKQFFYAHGSEKQRQTHAGTCENHFMQTKNIPDNTQGL
jgi:hypothetical protein